MLIGYGTITSHIQYTIVGCLFLVWLLLALSFRTPWKHIIGLFVVTLGFYAQTLILYMSDTQSIHLRKENMRSIIKALASFDKAKGHLPHYAKFDQNGQPMLSWRVMLLPYLGQEKLYQAFHLDEPWNSPHNLRLLPLIPDVYRPVERLEHDAASGLSIIKTRTQAGFTHIVAVRGPGSVFDSEKPINAVLMAKDTLLLAEAAELILWTKPEDTIVQPDRPPPSFHAYQSGRGFTVLGYLDGTVVNCYEDENESAFLNNSKLLLERIAYQPKPK